MENTPSPDLISKHLLPGERILWSGEPGRGILFTASDWFLIPFTIFWLGIVSVIFIAGYIAPAEDVDPLFFVVLPPFLSAGLFFGIGRFFLDAWLRHGIRYAVTDQRILIAKSRPTSNFLAVNLSQLRNIEFSARSAGRGSIRFGPGQPMFHNSNLSLWTPATDPTPQFLAIENVQQVFDLIQRAARH